MRLADCHPDRRHYAFGLCRNCRAKARRAEIAKPRSKFAPIEHGTAKGYQRHRYRSEDACGPCKRAWRDDHRRRYRPHLKPDVARMAQSIIDVLTTHDRWMTTGVITDYVRSLHPEWLEASVRRRIVDLARQGVIEGRPTFEGTAAEYRADADAWELVA